MSSDSGMGDEKGFGCPRRCSQHKLIRFSPLSSPLNLMTLGCLMAVVLQVCAFFLPQLSIRGTGNFFTKERKKMKKFKIVNQFWENIWKCQQTALFLISADCFVFPSICCLNFYINPPFRADYNNPYLNYDFAGLHLWGISALVLTRYITKQRLGRARAYFVTTSVLVEPAINIQQWSSKLALHRITSYSWHV